MIRKVSSPNKIESYTRLEKSSKRMGKIDIQSKNKTTKKPVKTKKGTTLDDCNLDNLILD